MVNADAEQAQNFAEPGFGAHYLLALCGAAV
jgi:hypothetical protein